MLLSYEYQYKHDFSLAHTYEQMLSDIPLTEREARRALVLSGVEVGRGPPH
jgi:hypothetical protein